VEHADRLIIYHLPLDVDVSDYPSYTTISISIDTFQNQPHIDAVMNAAVGEELTVTLGSNPTTGFRWSEFAEISDETIVQQTSHKYVGFWQRSMDFQGA